MRGLGADHVISGHGDSMTELAQWGQLTENKKNTLKKPKKFKMFKYL